MQKLSKKGKSTLYKPIPAYTHNPSSLEEAGVPLMRKSNFEKEQENFHSFLQCFNLYFSVVDMCNPTNMEKSVVNFAENDTVPTFERLELYF